ncbi:hypothetical protein LNP74_10295 [Klebsiella pneumoniae subsp. pneumoniae]|nr:hypothetical protein [Klebsiella pneumoniae subsp. pneumoniae]
MKGQRWQVCFQRCADLAGMRAQVPGWRPKNSPPQYAGPIRLRRGLGQSKNVVMVRAYARHGRRLRRRVSAALWLPGAEHCPHGIVGAGLQPPYTPLQVARGYSVMANGGFLVNPFFIS